MRTYSDRLDSTTYAADEPYGIAVALRGTTPTWEEESAERVVWLPERVFHRLVALGRAYELHVLPLLIGDDAVRLNHLQAAVLLEELQFLAELINDPNVRDACERVGRIAQTCIAGGGRLDLVIEGP